MKNPKTETPPKDKQYNRKNSKEKRTEFDRAAMPRQGLARNDQKFIVSQRAEGKMYALPLTKILSLHHIRW
ncbi:hypothetical protein RUM43_002159 [Polyplax serrata]|uniref:Uncharacterized protein n=1 Tax=Polyplax serrata TaxID=468196 RepID=A0AAN8PM00_POLSC